MLEPAKKTLDGLDFQLSPLPAWRAMETFSRVLGFLSPLADGLGALKSGEEKTEAIAKAISGMAKSDPKELLALSKILLESCQLTLEGKTTLLLPVFDVVMQGKLLTVFKLLAWAVEVNYADFFGVLRGALTGAKAQALLSSLRSVSSPSGPAGAS